MELDAAAKNQLQLLCDTVLYADAQNFVKEHHPPDNNQLNGLLAYAKNAKVLASYVARQRERNWGEGYKGHYSAFFGALDRTLRSMKELAPPTHPTTGEKLSKQGVQAALDILYRAFIHHLVAHALFLSKKS